MILQNDGDVNLLYPFPPSMHHTLPPYDKVPLTIHSPQWREALERALFSAKSAQFLETACEFPALKPL